MYLLDTNACIAVINGKPPSVRIRLQKEFEADARVFVSAIVAFELWYGVAKSARQEANAKLLTTFFAGPLRLLAFAEEDARIAGETRAALEAVRKPIGAYDLLIAGQALRHKLTLVTANAPEFGRIKNLDWEDWAKTVMRAPSRRLRPRGAALPSPNSATYAKPTRPTSRLVERPR